MLQKQNQACDHRSRPKNLRGVPWVVVGSYGGGAWPASRYASCFPPTESMLCRRERSAWRSSSTDRQVYQGAMKWDGLPSSGISA